MQDEKFDAVSKHAGESIIGKLRKQFYSARLRFSPAETDYRHQMQEVPNFSPELSDKHHERTKHMKTITKSVSAAFPVLTQEEKNLKNKFNTIRPARQIVRPAFVAAAI